MLRQPKLCKLKKILGRWSRRRQEYVQDYEKRERERERVSETPIAEQSAVFATSC